MLIDEWQNRRRAEAHRVDKEIKVKIPLDYHIKLHTVKVVRGQNISETVTAALARYFNEMRGPEDVDVDAPKAPELTVTIGDA